MLPMLSSLVPVEGAQEVRVIVGPDRRVGVKLAGLPPPVFGHAAKVSGVAGYHYPVGDELARRTLFYVLLAAAGEPGVLSHVPKHGLQVQVPVGDVHEQDPVLLKLVEVQVDGLPRHQVNGYRVRGEGVRHDDPVLLVGSFGQGEAGVAQYHFVLARTVAQVGEEALIARYVLDQGVYLVEGHLLSGLVVAGHGTRAQADDGGPRRHLFWQGVEGLPYRARIIVVGGGDGRVGPEGLGAVVGVAKDERVALLVTRDPVDPEEATVLEE